MIKQVVGMELNELAVDADGLGHVERLLVLQ